MTTSSFNITPLALADKTYDEIDIAVRKSYPDSCIV